MSHHKYHKYVVSLWLLLQLFIAGLVNCQMGQMMQSYTPMHQGSLTATLINNKLYFLNYQNENEFFYLDVSVPFNTKKLPWQYLSNSSNFNAIPQYDSAVAVKGGANNSTLFLYGGLTRNTATLVYTFDPQSNAWSVPEITEDNAIIKGNLTGIIGNNGKLYLWGGVSQGSTGNVIVDDMLILDTISLNWGKGSSSGAPTPRVNYGAVLLPDQNILYMGGHDQANDLTLDVGYLYDTINNKWNSQKTVGLIPPNEAGFSAVLGLDGQRVIIFGGSDHSNSSLYVLKLDNFEWSIPKVSGQIPTSRSFHKADVIGNYMVVSFGFGYDRSIESDILLLDISNNDEYTWTDTFNPSPSSKENSKPDSIIMIGAIIGLVLGGIALTSGVFFLYMWSRKQRKALQDSGSIS